MIAELDRYIKPLYPVENRHGMCVSRLWEDEVAFFISLYQNLLLLRSKSSLLVLALRRNTLSSWATICINQIFIYAQLH
jgi:hypothetical protein